MKLLRLLKKILLRIRVQINIFFIKKNISGKDNEIIYKGSILKKVSFDIKGHHNSIFIMKGCKLMNTKFYIRGNDNSIILHNDIIYKSGTFWTTCNNGKIEIGCNSTAEYNVNMQISEDNMKIEVGNDALLSSNISIWTQDWHKIYDVDNQRINYAKSIKIKNHVWIGYDVKILKGVTIGNNNIIGSNTIVTKSFDDENVIIVGNPGRIVKRGVNWKR